MSIGFIHIGMAKTASTYMQNLWIHDPSYALSWSIYNKQIEQMRHVLRQGKGKMNFDLKLMIDGTYKEGQSVVVSHEGFSSSFLNEVKHQTKIPEFISHSCKMLKEMDPSNENLLIVVREPLAWIKSIYIQSVKQGGEGSAQKFIDHQNEFIKHALNLRGLVDEYSKYFDNILVLPFELFKDDEKTFWDIVSYSFDTPEITFKIKNRVNEALSLERVQALSHLNGQTHFITRALQNAKSYNNPREKAQLISTQMNNSKWTYRRFLEHCSDKEFQDFCHEFNVDVDDVSYFEFKLSEELMGIIKLDYIDYLLENIDPQYPIAYLEKLIEHNEKYEILV